MERGKVESASVYDFFYHDARRVASYLAQFNDFGSLTGISHTEAAQKARQKSAILSAEGGLAGVAKAGGQTAASIDSHYEQTAQRAYDPLWVNALSLLDLLDQMGLIERQIGRANIGQFVLCSGLLKVIDLQMLEKTWRLPSVKKVVRAGAKGQQSAEIDLVMDLLSVMPHTIQARMATKTFDKVWFSLNHDGLTSPPSDVTLKHGVEIAGEWNILGVLDAERVYNVPPSKEPDLSNASSMAFNMMSIMAPVTRTLLGRPDDHYGVTPLLVFRRVTGETTT